ncbi:MAG: protein kinase [Sandaracinaceae bacterium]|nr:protein kinase [Sandaracinaceae bacterium]
MTTPSDTASTRAHALGPDAPRRLGRYTLVRELASGGMATVYLARAEGPQGFEKLVALKVIHPHLAKQRAFVDMFLDEARLASRITHPNVCGVTDFGEADGRYFLTMEYLVGESLGRFVRAVVREPTLRNDPRRWAIVARLVADACEGLHAAHEVRGPDGEPLHVVHRDVTPGNLVVSYDGALRVVDFGIASARMKSHRTETGELKGTVAFMSPEACAGEKVDRRADVWSLGVVLWELLTLERLFKRDTMLETLTAVRAQAIPPPSSRFPTVPAELDAIALRALSREPDGRYASAREMGRELLRFLASTGEPLGLADVAEWMDRVFPGGRARHLELLAEARAEPVVGDTEDTSAVQRKAPAETERLAAREATETLPEVRPSSRRVALAALGAVALLGLAGGLVLWAPEAPVDLEHTATSTAPAHDPSTTTSEPTSSSSTGTSTSVPRDTTDTPDTPDTSDTSDTDTAGSATTSVSPETATGSSATRGERTSSRRGDRSASSTRAPATSAPRGEGAVSLVVTDGWADVYEGAQRLGQTPLRVSLPEGTHTLELRPFGSGAPRRVRVEVHANETTRVSQRVSE